MARVKLVGSDKIRIDQIVGDISVGVPDSEVRKRVVTMCERVKDRPPPGREPITTAYCRELARYAVAKHQRNRGEYVWVQRGLKGRPKRVPLEGC